MNRLIYAILICGMILGTAPAVFAQDIELPFDTMRVVDSYGRPGDTVNVGIYFSNTSIAIGGYTARIIFSPNLLEMISVQCVDRGCELDATSGQVHDDSALVILAYTFNLGHFIPRGRGVVANIRLRVRPSAQPGTITTLRFIDAPDREFINSWADTTAGFNVYYPSMVAGNFSVTGGGSNQPPVIGNIGPQQVAEGQLLQFAVIAHDPNGDPVTLSAQNLPSNATFPTVQGDSVITGNFTFAPDFEQGPDTFFVSFVAVDDHNNTNTLVVQIVVLDQPNDIITVNTDQGGVPGATGRNVSIDMFNSHPVFGLQFEYFFDEDQIQVIDVLTTDRCLGLGFWYSIPEPGRIVILIFSPGLDPILAGSGTIVQFITDVDSTAIFGRTPITLDSAIEVIDSIGTSRSLITENGYFSVDRFGDANLDEFINVGDCITIVAYIIERLDPSIRQFDAADINRDGRVNVVDLQNIIDLILEIPVVPGPPHYPRVLAELSQNPIFVGDEITVPLLVDIGTEAAAVQYKLNFNPDHLQLLGIEPGGMVSELQFDSNINDNKINGVFYHLGGSTFGPAQGEMVNFRFRLMSDQFSPRDLTLEEFVIVDLAAGEIPSEIVGQLPANYVLNQNYPNPFNSSTTISFDLPYDSDVVLSIYDVLGRKVVTLVNSFFTAGTHAVTWNGRSDSGDDVATGVLFYRLQTSEYDETRKMLLIK